MADYSQDEIKNELIRRGVFSQDEIKNELIRRGALPASGKPSLTEDESKSSLMDTLFNPVTNVKNIGRGIQDFAGGLAGLGQKTASMIGEAVEPATHAAYQAITGNKVPHFPVREFMGLAGDNQFDLTKAIAHDPNSFMAKLGGFAPALGAGSLLRGAGASGLIGAIQADPGQQNAMGLLPSGRIGGGLADAAMVGAGGAALKYAPPVARYLKSSAANTIEATKNFLKTAKEAPKEVPEINATANQAGNELINKLGLGSTNKEEGATKLASMIREKHDQRQEQAGQFFKYVMNTVGKNRLYEHVDPLISTALNKEMPMMEQLKGLDVKPLYEKFKAAPTIENAHWLKSELGTVIGDLEKNTAKSVGDRAVISNINGVRKTLDYDIRDALKRHDMSSNDNISPMYDLGVDLHKTHVEPFRSSPALRDITIGGVETPKNIENIFDTPTNIVKRGKSTIGSINKVISDLPDEAKDLILFNKIGASKYIGKPEELINALNSAKNEGFSSYFNPHVNEAMESIPKKLSEDKLGIKNIEERNKKIEEAKKIKKNLTIGLAGAGLGTGLTSTYKAKQKIESTQDE